MLNINDVRTEQAIAQERFQVIVQAHAAQRARVERGEGSLTFYRSALSWLAERLPRPATGYETTREQTA